MINKDKHDNNLEGVITVWKLMMRIDNGNIFRSGTGIQTPRDFKYTYCLLTKYLEIKGKFIN